MNWISIAKKLLGNVVGHEKTKEFKDEFIGATIDWIKPFFLEEIPEEEIETASKEKVEASIQNLLSQEKFQEELEKFVEKSKEKNIVKNVTLNIKGNANVGDKGKNDDGMYNRKNVIEGSKMDVGGDLNVGDA